MTEHLILSIHWSYWLTALCRGVQSLQEHASITAEQPEKWVCRYVGATATPTG